MNNHFDTEEWERRGQQAQMREFSGLVRDYRDQCFYFEIVDWVRTQDQDRVSAAAFGLLRCMTLMPVSIVRVNLILVLCFPLSLRIGAQGHAMWAAPVCRARWLHTSPRWNYCVCWLFNAPGDSIRFVSLLGQQSALRYDAVPSPARLATPRRRLLCTGHAAAV